MSTLETKLAAFAALLEQDQLRGLISRQCDCECNRDNCKVKTVDGKKYVKVDVGTSGKYMVEKNTQAIFGIKAYGVIHRGHQYGTLDTITEWDWSEYQARRIGTAKPQPKITILSETF
jgi:hypothetical protein